MEAEMSKIVVTLGALKSLDPTEKVAKVREIKATCDGSDAFNASTACQSAMTAWLDRAATLEKAHTVRAAKEAELQKAIEAEQEAAADCDATATIFVDTAVATAKGDPEIVRKMGLTLRAEYTVVTEVGTVTGLRMSQFKKTGDPKLEWNETPGAALYRVEMSTEPVSETSWTPLYGRGRVRRLPLLVRGQRYSFRVCAVGTDGKASPWSATVSFVAE
jgi:hypothetical protein